MKKLLNLKSIIGLGLISLGLLLPLSTKIDNIELNIDKPSVDIINAVKPISNLITGHDDKIKLAIFNQEFSSRVKSYDADTQQVNDVYVLAAASFFKDSLNNKYADLDILLVELIKSCTTDDNHKLTIEEKDKLSEKTLGLAWSLIN